MTKCSFCGYEIERGTGKIKFMKDEKVVHLCSMKCEKNMFKLKRIPRETCWTADYKAAKTMRMATEQHHKVEEKTAKKTEAKKETKPEVKKAEKKAVKAEAPKIEKKAEAKPTKKTQTK